MHIPDTLRVMSNVYAKSQTIMRNFKRLRVDLTASIFNVNEWSVNVTLNISGY